MVFSKVLAVRKTNVITARARKDHSIPLKVVDSNLCLILPGEERHNESKVSAQRCNAAAPTRI